MRLRPMSLLLAAVLAVAGATSAPAATSPPALVDEPTAYVDPLIGTRNAGNVFPGAVTPFGMFSFSPENTRGDATRTAAPGGYHYDATRIRGFSLTHMSGTGCAGGSGDIPLFPYAGEVTSSPASDTKDQVYAADFSHADETAEPGRYRVGLASGVTADLTATARTGSARFTYPADKIEIDRPYGNDISVRAEGAAADAPYIRSLKIDGRTSERPWLPASFVRDGGRLDLTLSGRPDKAWGSAPSDAPPSFREGEQLPEDGNLHVFTLVLG